MGLFDLHKSSIKDLFIQIFICRFSGLDTLVLIYLWTGLSKVFDLGYFSVQSYLLDQLGSLVSFFDLDRLDSVLVVALSRGRRSLLNFSLLGATFVHSVPTLPRVRVSLKKSTD